MIQFRHHIRIGLVLLLIGASADGGHTQTLMSWEQLYAMPSPALKREQIRYGRAPLQFGELWLPRAGAPRKRPIIMIHGGCWRTAIADRTLDDQAVADLVGRGHPVWNIEYGDIDRAGGGYPGTFADVASAADLWPQIVARRGLSSSLPIALGHSAGGHLALWLAGRHNLPRNSPLYARHPLRLRGVVSLGGLLDLPVARDLAGNSCGGPSIPKLVAAAKRADPFADTSVPRMLPLGVPVILVHGASDPIVPFQLARQFQSAATAAGDQVELTDVEGEGHVEEIVPGTKAWAAALAAIDRLEVREGREATLTPAGDIALTHAKSGER